MKYQGTELKIKDKKVLKVVPSPYLVEIKDWDGNKKNELVEPDNNFYTIVESYGKIKSC